MKTNMDSTTTTTTHTQWHSKFLSLSEWENNSKRSSATLALSITLWNKPKSWFYGYRIFYWYLMVYNFNSKHLQSLIQSALYWIDNQTSWTCKFENDKYGENQFF